MNAEELKGLFFSLKEKIEIIAKLPHVLVVHRNIPDPNDFIGFDFNEHSLSYVTEEEKYGDWERNNFRISWEELVQTIDHFKDKFQSAHEEKQRELEENTENNKATNEAYERNLLKELLEKYGNPNE